MPSLFHKNIRFITVILLGLLMLTYVKLRYLSDPADVDHKNKDGIIAKPSNLQPIPTTAPTLRPKKPTSKDKPTAAAAADKKPSTKPSSGKASSPKQPSPSKNEPSSSPPSVKEQPSANDDATSTRPTQKPTRRPTRRKTNSTIPIQRTKIKLPSSSSKRTKDDFVEESCALESAEWYPNVTASSWQQRAPYVVLAGTMEAGIPSVTRRLAQHSHVMQNRHSNFFLPKQFRYYLTVGGKPKVWSARQHLLAKDYHIKELKNDVEMKAMDASTSYLFWSTTVPQQLFCTCPWTKVIVMLRNPLDRLVAHHQAATSLGLKVKLEDWVEEDLESLRDAGVNHKSSSMSNSSTAWETYLSSVKREGPIGRGLYHIQLQQWLTVLQQLSKLEDDVLILNYDDWKRHPDVVWDEILSFLQLSPDTKVSLPNPSNLTAAASTMMDETLRKQLLKFYKPYNQKLYKLLGWDPVWD